MKLKLTTLIICFLFNSVVFAQAIDTKTLDNFITHIENNNRGIGSVSIFKDGKEIYNRSFGQTKLTGVKYNADTKYQIGSITKTVTASLIYKLIENKKLSLDDKLSKFYPEIPNADKIKIKQLLEHSSGLGDYVEKSDSTSMWLTEKVTEKEIFDEIIKQGVLFQPNENIEYSNSGYYLLTKIVEKLFKKDYASIVKDEISKPLNLKDFSSQALSQKVFQSYKYFENWEKIKDFDFSNVIGVGDITATTKDLNTFLYDLFNYKIVKKEIVEQMKPQNKAAFGRGLMFIPFYEQTFYGHTGGTYGTNSIVGYNENDKIGFAISMNGVRFTRNDFSIGILSIIYGKEYEFPNFNSIVLKSEDLDKYLGVYSGPDFPLKLTITKEGNVLKGQGTGQPSFSLECYEEDKFKLDEIKLKIEFNPEENKLKFNQGGYEFELKKE